MKGLLPALPGVAALGLAVFALGRASEEPAPTSRAAAAPAAPRASTLPSFRELYARVDGVVARIDARRGPGDPPFGNGRRDAIGAAFVIDDHGHMVTNAHVVDRARSASVRFGRSASRIPARIAPALSHLAAVRSGVLAG